MRAFRKIVTPIGLGYIWLVLAWFLMRPDLPSTSEAKSITGNIYEVAQTMGKYLGLMVATVLAFGLGWVTIWLLMFVLGWFRVPDEVRRIYLRRPELAGRRPSYGNFREELTTTYVLHGIAPPELYNLGRFVDDFRGLCAQIQLFWAAPLPLLALETYLSMAHSSWWLITVAITPILWLIGYRHYVLACRMLSRAGLVHAQQMHAEAEMRWFDGPERPV